MPSIFTGPPMLSERQRQLIGAIPYIGPAYTLGRGINALYHYLSTLNGQPANQALPTNDPDYGNPNYIGLGTPTPEGGAPAAPAAPPAPAAASHAPDLNLAGIMSLNSYNQGTTGGYGGGSQLQRAAAFRAAGLDPNATSGPGYVQTGNIAAGQGALAGGGAPIGGPGRSLGFLVK